MKAAILAVGSELLGTDRLDTNSLKLTALLERHGVELRRKAVIGDSEAEIAAELRNLLPSVDLILITGGLGPTADDVTREAVAAALGRGLHLDGEVLAAIERRFQSLGWQMPEVNRRQAWVVEGAAVLANDRGTAPGLRVESGGCTLFLFPGVPTELEGADGLRLEPWLAERSGGVARETAVLKIAGLPESVVEERIAPAYDEFGREAITILANAGEIRLQATAAGPEPERRARLKAMVERLAELAGDAVFTTREEDTLESVVGDLLRAAGATLTAAESCTGGLFSQRITAVPGSSDYFLGGAITYSNELKTQLVGVPAEMIAEHGAVSEPVARAHGRGRRAALWAATGRWASPASPAPAAAARPSRSAPSISPWRARRRRGRAPPAPPAGRPRAGAPVLHPDRARDAAPAPAGSAANERGV